MCMLLGVLSDTKMCCIGTTMPSYNVGKIWSLKILVDQPLTRYFLEGKSKMAAN